MAQPLPSQPGPMLQQLNKVLHTSPFSFVFYGLFWSFILIFASPLAGFFLLVLTAFRCVRYAVLLPLGMAEEGGKCIRPTAGERELAVLVTGCDSGFGRDLALELSKNGFVVFAGCLARDAMGQFEGSEGVVPLKMDVAKQEEVDGATQAVKKWIKDAKPGTSRCLHALVNNAGRGTGGLIDWIETDEFRNDMEVNYYGMIRVVKAFLPVLKAQASSGTHVNSRIVNMVSMAGLFAAGTLPAYHGSKFAAEALSNCLRHELRPFGISVVTVNPTMHQTPLTRGMEGGLWKQWQSLHPDIREEYGEVFFEQYLVNVAHTAERAMWRANIVVDQMVSCVELESPPSQCVVGADGKYGFLLLRHLPVWVQDLVVSTAMPCRVKPALLAKDEKSE